LSADLLDAREMVALARLDFEKERFDHALLRLKQVVAKKAGDPEALSLLGATYARLRLWDKAQAMLQAFLKLHPDALNERFQLGMTFFESGDNTRAIAVWEQVLKQSKNHPPALFHIALANARQGQLKEALALCEAVLANASADNLFHGRAKDLAEKLRKDPRLTGQSEPGAAPRPRKKH
jgi:cytochrome c-type biogenesis protein CcmH/NrfG